MDCVALLLAVVIAGVNFGWQPAFDGTSGYEYVVRVEPELIDALANGETVPIESNIPPGVGPIRKVRLEVGRGELPRRPLRHSANFAGQQSGWAPDRYTTPPAGSGSYDRYAAPPPTLTEQAGNAVSNSADAFANQVQSGAQSTGQQLSRVAEQTANDTQQATQQFGRQLQQWSNDTSRQLQNAGTSVRTTAEQAVNATGNQLRQAGNSPGLTGSSPQSTAGANGVTAPPWPAADAAADVTPVPLDSSALRGAAVDTTASPGMEITRTASGWTSIGSNVAAPPLLNPPLPTTAHNNANLRLAAAPTSGSTLPAPPANTSREPIHSLLVDPSRQPANGGTVTDWGNAWGTGGATTPATIGRSEGAPQLGNPAGNSRLVPVPPRYPSHQSSQQASNRWNDPWAEDDPWAQPQQQQGISAPPPAAGIVSSTGQAAAANTGWQTDVATLPPAGANGPGSQPLISQAPLPPNAAGFPPNGSQPGGNPAAANPGGNQQPNQGPPAGELPWVPLLVVSLSLVGSLSANLFLGWSYIDARQKYRSLVRKTADTFRRAAGAAAA